MTHLHLTYRHSASRQDEAMENCVGFGSQELVPPPTAPCVREVSWGSQSVSVLLMGCGGVGSGYGSAAAAPSSEIHIFMDATDRDIFWHPSHTNFSGRFTNDLVRILHKRSHPTNGGSEHRLALRDAEGPPPPLSLASSTSIEILHTGRSSRSIVSDLLWEDSFNSPAMDDPLACYRDGYRTQWSTLAVPQDDSAASSLLDAMATKQTQDLGSSSSTSTCSESSSSDDDSDDTGTLWGEPPEGSSSHSRTRDVAPRMPSRRRRLSEDST
jgi:hypothetical protein